MSTIEELNLLLNNESKERKTEDNSLKVLLSNEKAERSEADATNRIKIANESVNRAESDSSIAVKLAKEVTDRATENANLEVRIAKLEAIMSGKDTSDKSVDNKSDDNKSDDNKSDDKKTDDNKADDKLMISQEMFERQLNMLKRSAKFILTNANIDELAKTKESSVEFLRHLNNLQLTFDNLLTNKDKYTLTDATKKCITEAKSLKKQLDELANSNWDVDRLFDSKARGDDGGC